MTVPRFEFADPPPAARGPSATKTTDFYAAIKARPGEWAIYSRTVVAIPGRLRKLDNVELSIRRNYDADGTKLRTVTVYGRYVGPAEPRKEYTDDEVDAILRRVGQISSVTVTTDAPYKHINDEGAVYKSTRVDL